MLRQKRGEVLQDPLLEDHVVNQRTCPLGDLPEDLFRLIRSGAVKEGERGPKRLEIQEAQRITKLRKELPDLFRVGVLVLSQEILHLHLLRGI